ncbi:hypothetical protein X566_08520 [Afipia sp. P52-10]|nr:hypothetical protein X566_08520 [Afipia sp. P52-10]
MRKIVNAVVLLPLAIVFVVFAVANRHMVTVSLDPFNTADPALSVTIPLFVVILLAAIAGALAGGAATWFRQGRWRRAARRHQAEAQAARSQRDGPRATDDPSARPGMLLPPSA